MIRFTKLFAFLVLVLFAGNAFSQDNALQFSFDTQRLNDKEVLISIKAKIPSGIKLFGVQKSPEDLMYSSIKFDSSVQSILIGPIVSKGSEQSAVDPALQSKVHFFNDSVAWQQKVKASLSDSFLVKGTVSAMYQKGADYLPQEEDFKIFVLPQETTSLNGEGAQISTYNSEGSVSSKSLGWIFLTAFAGGILALITPCIYAMIPVTVSFFTKRSKTKAEGIRNAFTYAVSIIFIFTLLGFLITIIFGPAALNQLATNWIANLIFFLLFLVFAISFLGAFEMTLPSSWSNKADSKAGTGSFIGIFFMALTLVVVSFSCTGPIIGNLLVIAARGSYWGPLVGMFGFSLALSLPFAFFAFFPGKMNMLGKSGGWLNGVKVTLGFLELALALKFLSNADLSQGWRILDREVFLTLWIVIFILLGIYLLGKIKFHHDDELPKNDYDIPYLSVTRLFFAIAAFSFAVYMIPGLWGAPLKGISAFVPPMGTQDFTIGPANKTSAFGQNETSTSDLPQPQKYYDRMKIYEPEVVVKYGMVTYFDYDEALAVARKLKKPLMLDFTGVNCVNCRNMEGQVWSDPQVMNRLKENFVIASLYVDVPLDLQPADEYYSKSLGKKVTTLSARNADLQVSVFNANTQPYYFFLDGDEKRLVPEGYGYDSSIPKFIKLLDEVVAEYKKRK